MRQLDLSLTNYSVESKGCYPGNIGAINMYWYNRDAIGKYIKTTYEQSNSEQCINGIFVCPADLPDAVRSYSMNLYAGQYVSDGVLATSMARRRGKLWKSSVNDSSHMILLAEQFSQEDWPNDDQGASVGDGHNGHWSSKAIIGWASGSNAAMRLQLRCWYSACSLWRIALLSFATHATALPSRISVWASRSGASTSVSPMGTSRCSPIKICSHSTKTPAKRRAPSRRCGRPTIEKWKLTALTDDLTARGRSGSPKGARRAGPSPGRYL